MPAPQRHSLPACVLAAVALGLAAAVAHGQPGTEASPGDPEVAVLEGLLPLEEVLVLEAPPIVPSVSLAAASGTIAGDPEPGPVPFAEPFEVAVTPASHGRWETTSDGRTAVWRLRVKSAGALSLNMGFTRYRMPPGGRLRVYAPESGETAGPYTDADNEEHGQLWTPIVDGGDAVVEVAVPAERAGELELELTSVNRGFRDIFPTDAPTDVSSASHQRGCHIDVACPDADPYRDQVRSVGTFSYRGTNLCSGFLVNNTARDARPYFLTSEHCMSTRVAASLVVYWNYQSPTCGAGNGGSRAQNQSGAKLVAMIERELGEPHDFALLELDDDVDPDHDLFFAGWNIDPAPPSSAFVIGHPRNHVKSITFTSDPLTVTGYSTTERGGGHYLRTRDWDRGGIEGGSSGSPLFGPDKRAVGIMSHTRWRCEDGPAWSARLADAWRGTGVPKGRLADWLDPLGTGELAIDGRNSHHEPEVAGTLHDKALRLADGAQAGALAVDVAYGFVDLDGEDLVYTASSSSDSVAPATIDGSTVTVSPASAGTATVTVTATDGLGRAASQTFEVTVGANRSPDPAGSLDPLALRVEDGAATVDVADAFEDDDGDTLTWAAASLDESTATVEVSGSTVTVTPVSGGTATVAVTATDAAGSATTARQAFQAVVASRPPAAVGTVAPLALAVNFGDRGDRTVDVRGAFADPDGDGLTYEASSSDESVATVSMWRGWATVSPVSPGAATVTVTATDRNGSNTAATRTIAVTVENGSPQVLASAPKTIRVPLADGPRSTDLAALFADPDGDDLSYRVSPSARPAIATASLAGTKLTITPRAFGEGHVTATATDDGGSGDSVSHRLGIRVANSPPRLARSPDIQMRLGDPDREFDLSTMFVDPDGDAMSFRCGASSREKVARCVRIQGHTVTIRALRAGRGWFGVDTHHQDAGWTYWHLKVIVAGPNGPALGMESPAAVPEGGDEVVFRVGLTESSSSTVTVDYATSDGPGSSGAKAGVDYRAASGRLRFPANSTAAMEVTVDLLDDDEDDDTEAKTFLLTLSNATAPLAGGGSTLRAEATIEDDDDPRVAASFGSPVYEAAEGGAATVAVRLDRDPEREVELRLEATPHGGATAGDYSGVPASVTFGSGETSRTFSVAATQDDEDDDGETVVLGFATSLPDRVTASGRTTVAILDDDAPPRQPPPDDPLPPDDAPPPPDDDPAAAGRRPAAAGRRPAAA